ncbi:MAG: dual specificity protein phosphatase, partial [Candidatus Aerophobetes bacterium]|nr:dual specificity protein phosphatase [Candidatus Aerophobetes bacterium]
MIKLIEGLYQSGFPDFNEVIKENIQVVIHLAEMNNCLPDNPSIKGNFLYIWWPIEDGPMPGTRVLDGLSNLAVEFLRNGLKVLISCAAGVNRSSLLACLVMMKFLHINANKAIELIRTKNPPAL